MSMHRRQDSIGTIGIGSGSQYTYVQALRLQKATVCSPMPQIADPMKHITSGTSAYASKLAPPSSRGKSSLHQLTAVRNELGMPLRLSSTEVDDDDEDDDGYRSSSRSPHPSSSYGPSQTMTSSLSGHSAGQRFSTDTTRREPAGTASDPTSTATSTFTTATTASSFTPPSELAPSQNPRLASLGATAPPPQIVYGGSELDATEATGQFLSSQDMSFGEEKLTLAQPESARSSATPLSSTPEASSKTSTMTGADEEGEQEDNLGALPTVLTTTPASSSTGKSTSLGRHGSVIEPVRPSGRLFIANPDDE